MCFVHTNVSTVLCQIVSVFAARKATRAVCKPTSNSSGMFGGMRPTGGVTSFSHGRCLFLPMVRHPTSRKTTLRLVSLFDPILILINAEIAAAWSASRSGPRQVSPPAAYGEEVPAWDCALAVESRWDPSRPKIRSSSVDRLCAPMSDSIE
jgi:hypothetical protein